MAAATITIEDLLPVDPKQPHPFQVEVNYGIGGFNADSRAHRMIRALAAAVHADCEAERNEAGADEALTEEADALVQGGA